MIKSILANIILIFIITSCDKSERGIIDGPKSNIDQINQFGIYKVFEDSIILLPDGVIDLSQTNVVLDPFISSEDIDHFDLSGQSIHLKRPISTADISFDKAPFIVAESGNYLMDGIFYFWPNCCFPESFLSLTVHDVAHTNLQYTLQLNGDFSELFIDALPDSLIRQDLSLHIDSAIQYYYEDDEIVGADFNISITNNTDLPLLIIDPMRAPNKARISGWALKSNDYRVVEVLSPQYRVRVWNSSTTHTWSEEWYSPIEPGETTTLQTYSEATIDIFEFGTLDILFTFDNMAGAIPRTIHDALEVKPWIGTILHQQKIHVP